MECRGGQNSLVEFGFHFSILTAVVFLCWGCGMVWPCGQFFTCHKRPRNRLYTIIMSSHQQQPVVPNMYPKLQRICMCKLHVFLVKKKLHVQTACAEACENIHKSKLHVQGHVQTSINQNCMCRGMCISISSTAYPNYMCRGMCPPVHHIHQFGSTGSTVEQRQEEAPDSGNGLAVLAI